MQKVKESMPFRKVIKKASKVVLSSSKQVKNGRSPKAPYGYKWNSKPRDYTGFNDPNYPTAIICNLIPELNLHLVVIDLDSPKNENEVDLKILRTYALSMIEKTYCTVTPSGGVHIYFLSKAKPKAQDPRDTHAVNIDYQANTGTGRGKYIVADYRWDSCGDNKEYYTKMVESPDEIAIIPNSDDMLNAYLKILEKQGSIKNKKITEIDKIVEILKGYYKKGTRDNFSLFLAGYFKKLGYPQELTETIITEVFSEDEQISKRVANVKRTYEKSDEEIAGLTKLEGMMTKNDLEELSKLTRTGIDHLRQKIDTHLKLHRNPPLALLSAYLQKHLMIYTDPYVHRYYMQDDMGSFREINDIDIMLFCNKYFGSNKINKKICSNVLDYFTEPIEKDYDIIEFANGFLNTKTQEFFTNKNQLTRVPKISINLNWNPEAPGLEVEKLINRILKNPEHPEDMDLWMRAVGHAFMGANRIGKLTIITGPSGTGKSTLTTLLQHIFETSQIPISKINDNERFTLHNLINKDINIDDDIDNGLLKGIGNLNTVITGNGLDIEVKGENRSIHLTNQQIPRLFANGNTLPEVLGEGFERRLLLIHAKNLIEYDERNDTLQNDILLGSYDKKGMEWFVYTAITKYWEKMDSAITSQQTEEKMKEEHEFKSDPLKVAVSTLFEDSMDDDDFIPMSDVLHITKLWCLWAYKNGKISKEDRRPKITEIKQAMNKASFDSRRRGVDDGYGNKTKPTCYLNIKKTPFYKFILGESE